MNLQYLRGINRTASSFTGIDILSLGFDSWYTSHYDFVKHHSFISTKKEIIEQVNLVTRKKTKPADWDWHHVVETEHMATILFSGNLQQEKYYEMPTILIHKPEHRFFSQNFNNNEFRELSSTSKGENTGSPFQESRTPEGRKRLKARINNLKMMYRHMYINYPTLSKIADNVFDRHSLLLG